jgi:hypothetical protein
MERLATLSTEIHNNLANRFFHPDAFSDEETVRAAVKSSGARKLTAFFRAEDALLTRPYWSEAARRTPPTSTSWWSRAGAAGSRSRRCACPTSRSSSAA